METLVQTLSLTLGPEISSELTMDKFWGWKNDLARPESRGRGIITATPALHCFATVKDFAVLSNETWSVCGGNEREVYGSLTWLGCWVCSSLGSRQAAGKRIKLREYTAYSGRALFLFLKGWTNSPRYMMVRRSCILSKRALVMCAVQNPFMGVYKA